MAVSEEDKNYTFGQAIVDVFKRFLVAGVKKDSALTVTDLGSLLKGITMDDIVIEEVDSTHDKVHYKFETVEVLRLELTYKTSSQEKVLRFRKIPIE